MNIAYTCIPQHACGGDEKEEKKRIVRMDFQPEADNKVPGSHTRHVVIFLYVHDYVLTAAVVLD